MGRVLSRLRARSRVARSRAAAAALRVRGADDFKTAVKLVYIGALVLYAFAIAGLAIRVFLGAAGIR